MREMKLVRASTIATHEQPAGETRLQLVISGACRHLCQLAHRHVDIARQSVTKLRVLLSVMSEGRQTHAQCSPRALHDRQLRRDADIQREGQAEHAFVTDDPDLQLRAVVERDDQ